jgi:Phage portal protein
MASVGARLKHAWNAFTNQTVVEQTQSYTLLGPSSSVRPDNTRLYFSNERSIVSSIYMRMALDVASNRILHVRLDEQDRFLEEIDSGLNNCLTLEANLDQGAQAFRYDIAQTLFDKGVIAIVPVDTTTNPTMTNGYDIQTMRVGEIVQWYPEHVKVSLYNQAKMQRDEITLPKRSVAIVENPLYAVMNEPNSTLQRLLRKLTLLDAVDEASSSGKLDLIIQLPYVVKTEAKRQQAEQRAADIEFQLKGSKYGIAYTDGTEKITQLNRPAENNLLKQIEYLTTMLYGQLGLTPEIMNGTADEKAMLNYNTRTIDPVMVAIIEAMKRVFLTKTARTQGQSIEYYRDPFRLVPVNTIAELSDTFARNEVLTSNEIRQIIGYKPVNDGKSDELRNSNMPQPAEVTPEEEYSDEDEEIAQDAFGQLESELDSIFASLGEE